MENPIGINLQEHIFLYSGFMLSVLWEKRGLFNHYGLLTSKTTQLTFNASANAPPPPQLCTRMVSWILTYLFVFKGTPVFDKQSWEKAAGL